MFAFGLASVSFFSTLYEKWTEISLDLPQIQSDSPIYVTPVLLKPEKITQRREMSLYDFGGQFTTCNGTDKSEEQYCERNRTKIADFVWKHWQSKKRGYIIGGWKGNSSSHIDHIFIEPDENGKWQIMVRFEWTEQWGTMVSDSKFTFLRWERNSEKGRRFILVFYNERDMGLMSY